MTSFNAANLTGNFLVINTDGLDEACDMLRLTNDSTVDVTISFDGTNNHDFLITGQVLQLPTPVGISNFRRYTKIYLKGAAQASGTIYLSGYYRLSRKGE